MHGVRENGREDTSEESINDDEDGGGGGGGSGGSVRMLPLNPSTIYSSSSLTNHHRKSFPLANVFRPTPPLTWKAADEMIGVSVPRKARSGETDRCCAVMDNLSVHGLGLIHLKKDFNFYNKLHAYLASCVVDGVKVYV
ncbi:hypothetical protein RYX36_034698 [Vicia faba]